MRFILGMQGCFIFSQKSEFQWDLFKEYKDSPALANHLFLVGTQKQIGKAYKFLNMEDSVRHINKNKLNNKYIFIKFGEKVDAIVI